MAIADLDHFKRINDQRSHEVGDIVLEQFARLAETACRPAGFAARLGGEEFLLVLPGENPEQARRTCEQLVETVRRHPWARVVGDLPVTVSVGVTTAPATPGTVNDLLSEADRLLYSAKDGGRDQVVSG